jgi:myo-inositol-1(or 4)-monophosphatase
VSLPSVADVAAVLRAAAQRHILPAFQAEVDPRIGEKAGGGLVTEVDHAVQAEVEPELRRLAPEAAFLGEEMPEADQRRALAGGEHGLWCLDPLDGTSNFVAGIPIFGISAALLVAGRPELGVILDPVRDELFAAVRGEGAWLNGRPVQVRHCSPLRRSVGVIDFKRLPADTARGLAGDPPYHSQRNFGASVLEWCWLACGRVDFYLHGGQNLWDFAAGALIASEAGAEVATLEGEAFFAGDILRRSVLAVSDPALRRALAPYLCPGEAPGQR